MLNSLDKRFKRLNPKIALLVMTEIEKLLEVGFIIPKEYSPWISNIVVVNKPNNYIRICIDFCDLNKESLKNHFPLPNIDIIVDSNMGHAFLSFMDGFFRYSQIFINPQDQYKTTFTTTWGTFCWVMIPFGFKNTGTTYQ